MGRALKKIELKAFKALAKSGDDVASSTLTKSFSSDVKVVGTPGDRIRSFVVSDASVDRDGDTISQDGWVLEPFNKGGAVLWSHDGRLPPIAQPTRTFVENGQLIGQAKFAPRDMPHPMGEGFGHTVMRMFDEGLMRAVSAGFLPLEFVFSEERGGFMPTDFKKQELLEWSPVPVPSNRNALQQARGIGIDIDPIVAWAETERDAGSDLISKDTLNAVLNSVAGDQILVEIKADSADDIEDEEEAELPELDPEQEIAGEGDPEDKDEDEDDDLDDDSDEDEKIAAVSAEDSADASGASPLADASASQTPAEVYASAQEAIIKAEAKLVDAAIEAIDALQSRGSMFSNENRRRLISSLDSIKGLLGFEQKEVAPTFLVELIEEQVPEDEDGMNIDPVELRASMDRILAKKIYQITGKLPQ